MDVQEATVNDLQIKICINLGGGARKSKGRVPRWLAITFANWLISQQWQNPGGKLFPKSCINFNKHIAEERGIERAHRKSAPVCLTWVQLTMLVRYWKSRLLRVPPHQDEFFARLMGSTRLGFLGAIN